MNQPQDSVIDNDNDSDKKNNAETLKTVPEINDEEIKEVKEVKEIQEVDETNRVHEERASQEIQKLNRAIVSHSTHSKKEVEQLFQSITLGYAKKKTNKPWMSCFYEKLRQDTTPLGYTPLHLAAALGRTDCLKIMIDHIRQTKGYRFLSLCLNARTGEENTPVMWAATNGHYDCVKLLHDNYALLTFKNKKGLNALVLAVLKKHEKVALFLFETYLKTSFKTEKEFLENIYYPTLSPHTAVALATYQESTGMVQGMVKLLNKIDGENFRPKWKWAYLDTKDQMGNTALIFAASMGFEDIAESLFVGGASVQVKNRSGGTALSLATQNHHNDLLGCLIGVLEFELDDKKLDSSFFVNHMTQCAEVAIKFHNTLGLQIILMARAKKAKESKIKKPSNEYLLQLALRENLRDLHRDITPVSLVVKDCDAQDTSCIFEHLRDQIAAGSVILVQGMVESLIENKAVNTKSTLLADLMAMRGSSTGFNFSLLTLAARHGRKEIFKRFLEIYDVAHTWEERIPEVLDIVIDCTPEMIDILAEYMSEHNVSEAFQKFLNCGLWEALNVDGSTLHSALVQCFTRYGAVVHVEMDTHNMLLKKMSPIETTKVISLAPPKAKPIFRAHSPKISTRTFQWETQADPIKSLSETRNQDLGIHPPQPLQFTSNVLKWSPKGYILDSQMLGVDTTMDTVSESSDEAEISQRRSLNRSHSRSQSRSEISVVSLTKEGQRTDEDSDDEGNENDEGCATDYENDVSEGRKSLGF